MRWAACVAALAFIGAAQADDVVPFPEPRYTVRIEKDVLMPMRDGVRLASDIYLPEGAGKRLPAILIRSQYGKDEYREPEGPTNSAVPRMFAAQGFAVVVQDIRGRFGSEGEYQLAAHDAKDGYDAVDWVSRQPWSNGKVGTYGCSSLGITQVFNAQQRHPALAAVLPQAAGGASRNQLWDVMTSGVPEIGWALEWFREDGNKVKGVELPKLDYEPILASLPVRDMADKAGSPPSDWLDYVNREAADTWWDQFGYFDNRSKVDVPALFVDSWYDMSVGETLYLHTKFRQNARSKRSAANQFVIISPTDHCASEHAETPAMVGEREMGDIRKDYWGIYVRWFDHWLRGKRGNFTGMPKVQYYVMGRNEWRGADEWPLPNTRFTRYYLHSGGHANSRFGDGTLSTQLAGSQLPDRYVYDPQTPVPSNEINIPGGARDQRALDMRHDRLVYTTPVLESGVEVTGPVEVVLYVSSSARDTDFTAQLTDVYPNGRAFNICSGIARARYREGLQKAVWMEPDRIYELRINLQATSNYFAPGHRIQVEVSSSSVPRFARNLNTGGNNSAGTTGIIAHNAVHHDDAHPSHVVLPVMP